MHDSEQNKKGWLPIVGLIALILVLFVGIKLVFAGLGAAIPQEAASSAQSSGQAEVSEPAATEQDTPAFCPFCGEGLNESFQWGQYCPYCGEKVEQ